MSKVKKVLSIDMDFIMSPCINLYNDCAGNPEFQQGDFWKKLDEIRGIDKHLSYDAENLLFIVGLISKCLKTLNEDKFFFGEEHDSILEFLCGDVEKADEIFDVYNVDHHHDLFYNPKQKEEIDRFNYGCLANWVYYLGVNDKINKYYWIRNENSMPFDPVALPELTFPVDLDSIWAERNKLFEVDFDYVFVCQSHEYFPDKYAHFFDMLKVMAENLKGCKYEVWGKPYCIDGKTRFPVPPKDK